MGSKKILHNSDIENLIKKQESSELIIFTQSESEMLNHVRQIYFPEGKEKTVSKHYNALNIGCKDVIERVVKVLSDGKKHMGVNLQILLYCFSKETNGNLRLNQSVIATKLSNIYSASSNKTHANRISEDYAVNISKLKNRKYISEDTYFYTLLKDNLLFSDSLIREGRGYIEIPKGSALEEYYSHPEYYKKNRATIIEKDKQISNHLVNRNIREEWEDFLNYIGKPWDDFFDKHYCVINYTFGYLFLTRSNQKIVDDLIEALYVQQTEYEAKQNEYEKVLNESKDAQAVMYEIMLKNGGAKEIAPDEDPNGDPGKICVIDKV